MLFRSVMNRGVIVENLGVEMLRRKTPEHPYTKQLMVASMGYDREAIDAFEEFEISGSHTKP